MTPPPHQPSGMRAFTIVWLGQVVSLLGAGLGAGMALMFVLADLFGALVGLAGYAFPAVRNAEESLPDHDAREPLKETGAVATSEIGPEYTPTGT